MTTPSAPTPALPPFPRVAVLAELYRILECIFANEADGEIRVLRLERAQEYKADVARLEDQIDPLFKRLCPDRDFNLYVRKDEIYVRADREEIDETDTLLEELEALIDEE